MTTLNRSAISVRNVGPLLVVTVLRAVPPAASWPAW
jgi:hypothetical protein